MATDGPATPLQLLHRHRVDDGPSRAARPPDCCVEAFQKAADRLRDDFAEQTDREVREERRRIITGAVDAIRGVQDILAGVLDDPAQVAQARRLTDVCIGLVRAAGCICEPVNLMSWGGPIGRITRTDPACGAHDTTGGAADRCTSGVAKG